jgi:hypothetical protein
MTAEIQKREVVDLSIAWQLKGEHMFVAKDTDEII